jgi:hypothetical protein
MFFNKSLGDFFKYMYGSRKKEKGEHLFGAKLKMAKTLSI